MIGWLTAVFYALDMLLCAILTGRKATTLSMASAQGESKKILAACIFCDFLSLWVQKNHCQKTLAGIPMGENNELRAGLGLLLLAALIWTVAEAAIHDFISVVSLIFLSAR
jgi:hypothetical protein